MKDLKTHIDSIRIIDGHEHIGSRQMREESGFQFYDMFQYIGSDLITAGMPWSFRDELRNGDPEQTAGEFLNYWHKTSNTGYARALRIMMRDLYGMEEWTVPEILAANAKVRQASRDPNWYKHVLKDRAGIDLALTEISTTDVDRELFRPVIRLDQMFRLKCRKDFEDVSAKVNRPIYSLKQYLEAVEEIIDTSVANGMMSSKLSHAYWRTLQADKVSFSEADALFARMKSGYLDEGLSQQEAKPLQDYLLHFMIQQSIKHHLPIQIHTGHHEPSVSRNGNRITNSRAADLVPLLLEYRDARFVLLHGGYPYNDEYMSIAKNFPNVYPDMSWLYIISPTVARQILHKLIDMVPQSKIVGFGGDYRHVEGAYAHSKMARENLYTVLREKVAGGEMNESEAAHFAERVLRDNLFSIYDLRS